MTLPAVVTDPAVLAGYLTDASNVPGRADALVRPRTAEEVAAVLRHCQERGIPVLPTAGRTSTTAGAVPDGGWLLSMEGFDRIVEIGVDTATAEAGVILGRFQREIEATGRLYPPDPTSRDDCTLGASIATNASGARTFRYGPTRDWVAALEVVLPTGEVLEVREGDPIPPGWPVPRWSEPPVKTAAGYPPPRSLLDLFVGTEGTLGVITRATVRLTALPKDVFGLVAFFPDRRAATRFVAAARAEARANPRGALSPRCLEYYDAQCLALARERVGGVPDGAVSGLFCEQEVEDGVGLDGHLEAWLAALAHHGAFADDTLLATDAPSRARLLALRHAVPVGVNEQVVRNGMPKVGTDLAVPDAHLDEMMDLYEAAPFDHVLFGHIGDNHLHLNLLPKTADELARSKEFYDDLARRAIALGGTVSAEHGIGKLKRRHLEWMVGPETLAEFRALKRKLDPAGILGRGNVFDPADPIGSAGSNPADACKMGPAATLER
jgi:FAD/FMN-containing dehydrogenase